MYKRFGGLLCALSLACTLAYAQTGVGQIQGTVSDATGAILPNAPVSLNHTQTGNKFETTTSSSGTFMFPSLQPGAYKLAVAAPGLQRWEGTVQLRAGQDAVIDPSLQVAGTTEQVTVVGNVTPLVTTNSATLATTVERARIEQLPLNGRSIQSLLTVTVPGLEGGTAQPRVYGLRDSALEFTQDGVPLDDRNTGASRRGLRDWTRSRNSAWRPMAPAPSLTAPPAPSW
ncbi:MAG: hypothetical protein JWN34_122 [Bryobacterales bacterium]|nr:hypothetical protein [Bryobacterales bacterium]